MKLALGRWTLVLVAVAVTAAVTPTATPPAPSSRPARQPREAAALWARMPLAFVENRGQWDTAARFVAHRGALTAAFDNG